MFTSASAVERLGPGRYQASFDPSWFQGPGVYGGLSGAALLRAMAAEIPDRPARTLTVQYATTVAAGPATIEVTVERAGSTTAFASARLIQDGVRLHAMASFGADRSADLDEHTARMPEAPPASDLPGFVWQPPFPVFLQHFDVRFLAGLPYSGAAKSGVRCWVRSREVEPVDAPLVAGLLDVLPPAILARATTLRPVSTVVWHLHFLATEPLDGSRHFLVDVTSDMTRGGWSDQESRLFTADGQLVGYGRQLVAVIR